MKTKQLANVLIKILGLSVAIHSIPSMINGLYSTTRMPPGSGPGAYWIFPLSSILMAGIGIFLIVQSRSVTGMLFKDEEE